MAYGEFGGNGSMHWRISQEKDKGDSGSGKYFEGVDPIPNSEVGKSHGRQGHLRVEIEFADAAAAAAAIESLRPHGKSVVIHVKSNSDSPKGGAPVPAQVRVTW